MTIWIVLRRPHGLLKQVGQPFIRSDHAESVIPGLPGDCKGHGKGYLANIFQRRQQLSPRAFFRRHHVRYGAACCIKHPVSDARSLDYERTQPYSGKDV